MSQHQHLIDWNLERAAEELYWAKIIAHRNRHNPFLHDSEEMEECHYMAGMHIASANALIAGHVARSEIQGVM